MAKSAEAFRTISEVADWLQTPAHVLRFWESKFTQVKPVKRAGGRRYYRPADMELLGGIKRLLHDEGMTIKGVQKLLRDKGIAHVAAMSPALEDFAVPVEAEVVEMPRQAEEPVASPAPAPAPPAAVEARTAPEEAAPSALDIESEAETASVASDAPASDMAAEATPAPSTGHVPADQPDSAFPAPAGILTTLLRRRSPLAPEVAARAVAFARQLSGATL